MIKIISDLQNEKLLNWLLYFLRRKPDVSSDELPTDVAEIELDDSLAELHELARQPIPESIDLETLKKEQGYDPKRLAQTWKDFDHSLFDDEPPAEELVKMLTK